jgi:hypothetical protein
VCYGFARLDIELDVVFPVPNYGPPQLAERARYKPVASPIPFYLCLPEVRPGPWCLIVTRASMPKAAVNKDRDLLLGKYEVGFPN